MYQITSSSIDKNEMEMFKKLSSEWWDLNGPAKTLHGISELIVPYMQESLIKAKLTNEKFVSTDLPLKGVNILDAGCGGGINSEKLAKTGATVVGIDVNSDLIEVARNHASSSSKPLHNLSYVLDSLENHAKINCEKYDVVVVNFVLEHVNEAELFLKACAECLRPGGLIFVSTIGKTIMGWLLGITMMEDIFNLVPKGTFKYNKFTPIADTKHFLKKAKCIPQEERGLVFEVNTCNWIWVEDTSAFYMTQSVKKYNKPKKMSAKVH